MATLKDMRFSAHKQARDALHACSAETLAAVAGISKPTYLKYEEHPEKFSYEQASRLAEYLGCDVSDIFFGTDRN